MEYVDSTDMFAVSGIDLNALVDITKRLYEMRRLTADEMRDAANHIDLILRNSVALDVNAEAK